ncbi:MAG: ATP-binding protein [Halioglobus sp.]
MTRSKTPDKNSRVEQLLEQFEPSKREIRDANKNTTEDGTCIDPPATFGETLERTTHASLDVTGLLASLGCVLWDHRVNREKFVSQEYAKIHGFEHAEYLKRVSSMADYIELIIPEDRERYLEYELQFAETKSTETSSVEYRIVTAGGDIRHLKQLSQFDLDSFQSLCLLQDVTELRQAEADLSERSLVVEDRERMLALTASMTKVGYCVWNPKEHHYISVSDEWAAIFGYGKDEFVSKFRLESQDDTLVHPLDIDRYRSFYADAITSKDETYADIEYRVFRRDGEIRHVLERIAVTDMSSQSDRILITLQDITDRKLADAKIFQASKLSTLGEMAAGLAHEINQPLNTITLAASNMSGALLQEPLDISLLNTKLARIKNQVTRAAAIIGHIRTFGREAVEGDQLIDLSLVTESAIDLMREQLRISGIRIEAQYDDRCPSVLGHPIHMEQVLLNLLNNSRHAITSIERDNKMISIDIERQPNGDAILRVSDTGGGIPDEIISKIFEPFITTKPYGEGTGLGLSISHGIVKQMGGEIRARNIPDGALFELTFPAAS